MKLKQLSTNMTELEIGGTYVLFSYSTPVAAFIPGKGFFKTEKFHSRTTSKHINSWLEWMEAETKPQEWFDNLTVSLGEK